MEVDADSRRMSMLVSRRVRFIAPLQHQGILTKVRMRKYKRLVPQQHEKPEKVEGCDKYACCNSYVPGQRLRIVSLSTRRLRVEGNQVP